jgi:hypothetical protein
MNNLTLVTGLWDIGRGGLNEGWSRSFEHYKQKFSELLKVENNMIIFGEPELETFVYQYRKKENTQFISRNVSWFKSNEYYQLIQEIRKDPKWFNQVGWLKDSTQAKLELYNPLVMSKMFILHDAKILDKFNSEYLFWIDAGLTNTVHQGYFTHDKVLEKLTKYVKDFNFVSFPYETNSEIHGFKIDGMNEYADDKVNKVCRGGFFGGKKELLGEINTIYYNLLLDTLRKGYMGTEESIFTLMLYRHPELFSYSEIEGNGLMGKFFEDLKNDKVVVKKQKPINEVKIVQNKPTSNKVGLYVITFNSPNQFRTLIKSMEEYDIDFLNKTEKYLLDNSSDLSTTPEYKKLCEQYGFEHIKKDNLGICGGRQFISEHFNETDLDFMIFFEDDMFFCPKKGEVCKNGFGRFTPNLFKKVLDIIQIENLDFLKFNFTEFYGDNSTQWSWYNVPQNFRESHWPNNKKLPKMGLDPNAPRTVFTNIKTHQGTSYALGEVYYCNWPHIVSKEGNEKMFLKTKWGHPFEQTWMSHIFQETIKGNIKSGLLLLTPTEHNRFEHYDGKLRKES